MAGETDRLPRSLSWLNVTQFLGALNDNVFKLLVVFFVYTLMEGVSKTHNCRWANQMHETQNRLLEHYLVHGEYPAAFTSVVTGLPEGTMGFNYVDDQGVRHVIPLDPWGREYVYVRETPRSYTLLSRGPNTNAADDDIVVGASP